MMNKRTLFSGVAECATNDRRPPVLLALQSDGYPTNTLVRAAALSRALRAELQVLRVLPVLRRVRAPSAGIPRVLQPSRRLLRASRAASEWIQDALGDDQAFVTRVTIVQGDFLPVVASRAARAEAGLIVVPPSTERMGSLVATLAGKSGVPVLVARESRSEATIVAATDLLTEGYPVLGEAAALGLHLDAPVVAVHSVNPLSAVMAGASRTWPVPAVGAHPGSEADCARLAAASAELPVETRSVIRHEMNPADAILDEARARDANLVVVGTRRWFEHALVGSVAAQVVNRAKRSVLVTPLIGTETLIRHGDPAVSFRGAG
jgi:nucleotide-binding universal stress UspA family protein